MSALDSIVIAPSILSADFARMGEEVRALDDAQADWIHVDVMDGHFVPNLTFGPAMVAALRPHTAKPLDVHLMIAPADPYIEQFAEAGADNITVHVEAGPHIHRSLQTIRSLGKRAGVAINPGTPVAAVEPLLDVIDQVLVMSVNPGFGGQAFIPSTMVRVTRIRDMIGIRDIRIGIDGGVGVDNAADLVRAGASVLAAGSSVFRNGASGYADAIGALRGAATQGATP